MVTELPAAWRPPRPQGSGSSRMPGAPCQIDRGSRDHPGRPSKVMIQISCSTETTMVSGLMANRRPGDSVLVRVDPDAELRHLHRRPSLVVVSRRHTSSFDIDSKPGPMRTTSTNAGSGSSHIQSSGWRFDLRQVTPSQDSETPPDQAASSSHSGRRRGCRRDARARPGRRQGVRPQPM